MKALNIRLSLWCSINLLLLFSCGASKNKKEVIQENTVIEQPKPLTESETDSLKNYLDAERARRRQKQ
jgi:hypothetical protein